MRKTSISTEMGDDVKRYIKFLASCKNQKLLRESIKAAPDSVIKVIANAALNTLSGDIPLTKEQKKKFARHRSLFQILTTRKTTVASKRRAIQRGGGWGIVPIILSSVLSVLGSTLLHPRE